MKQRFLASGRRRCADVSKKSAHLSVTGASADTDSVPRNANDNPTNDSTGNNTPANDYSAINSTNDPTNPDPNDTTPTHYTGGQHSG